MNTTKTKAQRMTYLLESCGGFAEAVKLFREACAESFGEERTAELVCLENALFDAEEAAQALDDASA
jgi:hypothetical protein